MSIPMYGVIKITVIVQFTQSIDFDQSLKQINFFTLPRVKDTRKFFTM